MRRLASQLRHLAQLRLETKLMQLSEEISLVTRMVFLLLSGHLHERVTSVRDRLRTRIYRQAPKSDLKVIRGEIDKRRLNQGIFKTSLN